MSDEKTIVIDPGGLGFAIERLWVFVSVADDGDEGVAAFVAPGSGTWYPMVAADEKRLEGLIRKAQDIAKATGKRLRLVRFDRRTEIEVFHPDGRRERSG